MAITRTTLNNVLTNLKAIATAHKQINTFGFGDIWEIASSGSIEYPMMWTVLENSSIGNNTETLNFTLIFADIVQQGEVNEQDVLSDQLEIAKDVVSQLKHIEYDWDFKGDGVVLQDFTERFLDSVSGFTVSIALELPFSGDRCVIPTTDVNITSGSSAVSSGGSGTVNVYVDGSLISSTVSTDLDSEIVNINL